MSKNAFISSTSKDLKEYRAAVDKLLRRLELHPINMDDFGSQPGGASAVSINEVAKADIFVGIIARRYGYVPDGLTTSVTEQEYDEAVRLQIPRFMYLLDLSYKWPKDRIEASAKAQQQLTSFREKIEKNDVRSLFTTPDSLTAQVTADLSKYINNQAGKADKPRDWTIPIILGLVFAFISIVVGIVAVLPETQRNPLLYRVGLIPASETPTATFTPSPTATNTPLPTATFTPTPERLSASGFNVVVAGFGFQNSSGTIESSTIADDMSDIVANELNQITQIDNTLGWRSNGVGRILGQTPIEREKEAAQIAAVLNADVVVYGVIRSDGIYNIFEPEFYITAEFAALEPELIGADTLGNPVEFVGNSEDQIVAANTFQKRLGVMRYFLKGLSFYLAGNFAGAKDAFESGLAVESSAGLEILYVFAGNAAVRIPDADEALSYYNSALEQRPQYARALVGRGIALYRKALDIVGKQPPPYDPKLMLPTNQSCADVNTSLPTQAQLIAELALRCYQEASVSQDKPATADIDVKVAFGLGQTSLWLSLNKYGNYWDDVQTQLSIVINAYDTSADDRKARIRAATAHSHAWLGLRLLSLQGSDVDAVNDALNDYKQAVALLRLDVNREYDQHWIDLYGQQVSALEDWLAKHQNSASSTPVTTAKPNASRVPITATPTDIPDATLEIVG